MNGLAELILSHPRNERIEFIASSHEYFYTTDAGQRVKFRGVTGLLDEYTNFFDAQSMSKFIAYRDGKTQQQVLAEWEDNKNQAIDRGNYVHDTLETFVKTGLVGDEALVDGFVASYRSMGLEPVAAEWTIYDEAVGRASSIDGNFIDQFGRYVIVDYKTNAKGVSLEPYKSQRMLYPLGHLLDCKHSLYSLQVSMYWRWIQQFYLPAEAISNAHWILHIVNEGFDTPDWKFNWIPALDMRQEIQLIYNNLAELAA